ncbi:MAG: DUF86 domain-containing protein, partial [Planctomycetaceae bacterium]|nr:DUF86 domain-containing protein [Planctomycetaceae bacterium]
QIGELVTHLTDDFKAKNNSIPWQEIKAMRNVAAHHYAEFSLIVLWETITDDVPKLRNQCS